MQEDFYLESKILINIFMLVCIVGILACAHVIAVATNPSIAYVVGIVTGAVVLKLLKLIFNSIKEDIEFALYKFRGKKQKKTL